MTDIAEWLGVALLSIAPIAEARVAIPVGVTLGLEPTRVFLLAVSLNIALFFPIYFGLSRFNHLVRGYFLIDRVTRMVSRRSDRLIKRYSVVGILILVSLPLPITGVYTGTILAWLFQLDWKKSALAVMLGGIVSASIVFIATLAAARLVSFF